MAYFRTVLVQHSASSELNHRGSRTRNRGSQLTQLLSFAFADTQPESNGSEIPCPQSGCLTPLRDVFEHMFVCVNTPCQLPLVSRKPLRVPPFASVAVYRISSYSSSSPSTPPPGTNSDPLQPSKHDVSVSLNSEIYTIFPLRSPKKTRKCAI